METCITDDAEWSNICDMHNGQIYPTTVESVQPV